MTYQRVADTFEQNHATILHGNKKCASFLSLGTVDYVDAMMNWRIIFDEHHLDIDEEINSKYRLKNRVKELLNDSVIYAGVSNEEIRDMLTELLEEDFG